MYPSMKSSIGRLSWVFIFKDDPKEEGVCKYKATIMIPKNAEAMETLRASPKMASNIVKQGKEFLAKLKAQCEAIAKEEFGKGYKSKRWNPILDGDEMVGEEGEGKYRSNFWIIRTKTQYVPRVQAARSSDADITDEDTNSGLYSGCWAKLTVQPYIYKTSGNQGVGIGLGTIQKAFNDEPIGMSSAEEFDEDIEDLEIEVDDFESSDSSDLEDLE